MLNEGSPAARWEVMKVLGIIGALDPHTHKVGQGVSLDWWGIASLDNSLVVCVLWARAVGQAKQAGLQGQLNADRVYSSYK